MALAYLFAPTTQFQARTGANLTAGFLRVFYTQTDDAAPTYSDFAATPNEEEIVLDADGRAVVIVDSTKTYRLEVYNRNHGLMFTVDPLTAVGGAGGSMAYSIVSTDGTVSVESTSSGGVIYYDLSTAISNEAAKWGARECAITSLDGSNDWQPLNTVSTVGSVTYYYGWKATKDTAYDFAASVEMPSGIAGATFGIDVKCEFIVDGVCVCTETGYIDPSRNVDRVSFEYKGQVDDGQKLDARLYARCAQALSGTLIGRVFYNEECDGVVGGGEGGGETYIPGEYIDISTANVISVTGVQPVSGMSSYVQQSAFDDCCSAMSGYVSSLSSDVSALSAEISSITGLTGEYVEKSAISGVSAIWNEASGVSSKLDASASGEFYSTSNPSGFITGVDLSDYATTAYVDSAVSGKADQSALTGKLDNSASSLWYPMTGNPSGFLTEHQELSGYVEKSAISAQSSIWDEASGMSGKLENSASSNFYPMTGNPSGFLTSVDLSDYVEKSAISAQSSQWNEVSGLSGKLDNSASSLWYPMTGNPSGFLTAHQDLSDYVPVSAISAESSTWNSASAISAVIPWSALEGTGSTITAISGSAVGSTSVGKVYSGIDPIVVDNTADTISVNYSGLTVDSSITAYQSGTNIVIGVNPGTISAVIPWSALSGDGTSITGISGSAIGVTGDYVEKSARNVGIGNSNVISGQDTFAQGYHNTAIDYSIAQGWLNSASGEGIAQGDYNSAYHRSFAQGAHNRAIDDSFAQGDYNTASNYSFAQGAYNSAKNTATVFGQYNLRGDGSTSTGNSAAFAIGDGTAKSARHDLMVVTKDGEITMFSSTADTTGTGILSAIRALSAAASSVIDSATVSAIASSYAESAASGKLDSSASSSFYSVDNPSGFITGVDLSPYQLTADMSAYQPSGDYYSASNPSGFITGVDLSNYATTGYVDSSVSGKLDTTAFNSGDFYSTANPSGFITGVDLSNYATTAYVDSSVSGKLDTTAFNSGDFYSTSNPSGFITGVDLSPYQLTADMSAYQPSGDYAYNSALSGYIPTSESANYQLSGDYAYNSALTAYQPSGDYIYASALGTGEI